MVGIDQPIDHIHDPEKYALNFQWFHFVSYSVLILLCRLAPQIVAVRHYLILSLLFPNVLSIRVPVNDYRFLKSLNHRSG